MNILKKLFRGSQPHPLDRQCLLGLARQSLDKYEVEDVLTELDQRIEQHPDQGWLYWCRASVKSQAEQWDDQLFDDCEKMFELGCGQPEWLVFELRGLAFARTKQRDKALQDFTTALSLPGINQAAIYSRRATIYFNLKRWEETLEDCNRAIDLGQHFAPSSRFEDYFCRAGTYMYLKQYDKALEDWKKAFELSPSVSDDRRYQVNLLGSYLYLELGEFSQVINYSTEALSLPLDSGDHADICFYRGCAHTGLKQYEAALEDLSACITLDKDHVGAYSERGYVYHQMRRFDDALQDIERVKQLNPDNIYAYNNCAAALYMQNNLQAALAEIEKMLTIDPDFFYLYINRGFILFTLEQYTESLADLEKSIDMVSKCEHQEIVVLGQSLCHWQLGQREEALKLWRDAAEKNPKLKNLDTLQEDHIGHETTLTVAGQIIASLSGG
jgi:tetratricopeptide (TPR) repeat protein